jgi:hypothetical protein
MKAKYRSRVHKRSSTSMKNVYYFTQHQTSQLHSFSPLPSRRTTTAQGINCRLFTAALCVKSRGSPRGIYEQIGPGGRFLFQHTVFPVIYHTTSVSYTFITRGWYNKPICVCSILELVSLYFYVKQ